VEIADEKMVSKCKWCMVRVLAKFSYKTNKHPVEAA
jgi:hypothetical protein